MRFDAALALLRRGRPLAAKAHSTAPGHRAWVAVYPLALELPETTALLKRLNVTLHPTVRAAYRLRLIEVDEALIDDERSITDEDVVSHEDLVVCDEAVLVNELRRLGIEQDALEQHYTAEYPL